MKFSRPRRGLLATELTPLIDVVFLLLIFFAVSTSFASNSSLIVSCTSNREDDVHRSPLIE